MHSLSVVTLHLLVAQGLAQDWVVDNVVDELFDGTADAQSNVDLADTTLAIASAAPLNKVRVIQNQLKKLGMPSSKWQELSLQAMAASQTCGPNPMRAEFQRNPMRAELQRVFSWGYPGLNPQNPALPQNTGESYSDLSVPEKTQIDVKSMAGISAPLGYWDPLGLSTTFKYEPGVLYFFREAEVKHGRVCMLATLGIFAGEKYHPFLGGNVDLPAAAVRSMLLETDFQDFWFFGLLAIAGLEVSSVVSQYDEPFWEFDQDISENPARGFSTQLKKKKRLPGDFGFDPLGLKPTNPTELKEIQTKEINNGRLAMLATIGMLGQELVTGQKTFN